MKIILTHIHQGLWLESKILENLLDEDDNPKPLACYLKEAEKYAINLASEVNKCKKSEANKTEEYKNIFGWMGEVLAEFWFRLFGTRYDVISIRDTSHNQFQRGYDITGVSIFDQSMNVLIQIKMQGFDRSFKKDSLYTFFDEAEKHKARPEYTILMVPTSSMSFEEILSYKKDFKADYLSRMRFIGQAEMDRNIVCLPSNRGYNANLEFFTRFRDSLNTACVLPDFAI